MSMRWFVFWGTIFLQICLHSSFGLHSSPSALKQHDSINRPSKDGHVNITVVRRMGHGGGGHSGGGGHAGVGGGHGGGHGEGGGGEGGHGGGNGDMMPIYGGAAAAAARGRGSGHHRANCSTTHFDLSLSLYLLALVIFSLISFLVEF